jgi:hypothetical protein
VTTDALPRRRYGWGCLASVAAVLVAIAVAYCFRTGYLPMRTFDAVAWRQVQRADDETRLQMVESLLRSGRLNGLTRAQAVALLGPPDGGDYFSDWDLVYWLGPERGMIRIDSEWLVIRFDQHGRVSQYKVARD